MLLIALTPASEELQKLVAFENAFDIVLDLVEAEGALTHGSEVVADCLALLANLLRLNVSNQSYFRETGCVKKLAKLLVDVNQEPEEDGLPSNWVLAHRDKNIWGTLVIIQLFLAKGGVNTPANQAIFWNSGVMEQVLTIAFGQRFSINVTSKALATCADLIRGNPSLQEQFGDIEVPWGHPQKERTPDGQVVVNGFQRVNVIEALLKLSLEPASIQQLDARLAACECIKSFFANHQGIRLHVLRRAIEGHVSGQDEIPNILSVLLTPPESRRNADPYQTWMASVLMFHLVFENAEAKAMAMAVTEGDAENGEEVITCVQTIVGHLITGMQRGDDERITIGYLMLLCGWLFEDPDVVNDFLGEGSSIQTLLQETKHRAVSNVLVSGLCTILLGILYEFSSKDSPISRHTLHKLLIDHMGRDQYIDKICKFRESPPVRDFEVLPQTVGAQYDGGMPEIFFDRAFIEFLKDNFNRFIRAVDREPGLEISVITNGIQRGISREMVDQLRNDLETRNQAVQKLESDLLNLKQKVEQDELEFKKATDSSSGETLRMKQINESLQRNHEEELRKLEGQYNQAKDQLLKQHGDQLQALDSQLKEATASHEKKSQEARQHHESDVAELHETISLLESDLSRVKEQQKNEAANSQKRVQALESELAKAQEQHAGEVTELKGVIQKLESDASKVKEEHSAEVASLKDTIQNLESGAGSTKEQHVAEVTGLKSAIEKLETDASNIKAQNAAEVDGQNKTIKDLQSQLDMIKSEHEKELANQKSTAEKLQTELREKSTYDIQAVHDEYSPKLSALEKRAEEAEQKAHSAETNATNSSGELGKRAEEAERKAQEAESETKKTTDELQELRKQLEKAQSESKQKEEASKSAQSALDKAKSEAKEKEDARQATQSELDDLLIVFGDLEAKRNDDKVSVSPILVPLFTCFLANSCLETT